MKFSFVRYVCDNTKTKEVHVFSHVNVTCIEKNYDFNGNTSIFYVNLLATVLKFFESSKKKLEAYYEGGGLTSETIDLTSVIFFHFQYGRFYVY